MNGWIDGSVSDAVRMGHIRKQRIFAIYQFSRAVIENVDWQEATKNWEGEPTSEIVENCAKAGYERSYQLFIRAEAGVTDYIKQQGFYLDINDKLDVVEPVSEIGADDADDYIQLAGEAVSMARADEGLQRAMAAVYRESKPRIAAQPRALIEAAFKRAAEWGSIA